MQLRERLGLVSRKLIDTPRTRIYPRKGVVVHKCGLRHPVLWARNSTAGDTNKNVLQKLKIQWLVS